MITRIANRGVNAEVNALAALMNGGTMCWYDGVQPAGADVAVTDQVKLCTLLLGSPAFAAGIAGRALANTIATDSDASATGLASWYRIYDASGNAIMDGDISTSAGANLVVQTVHVVQHARVSVDAFAVTASKL